MVGKILVVDDSKLMHSVYDMMLKRYDKCKVLHASNGQEALDLMRQHPDCQLILLDVNMPVMGGLDFLKLHQAEQKLAAVPVILVTTEGAEEERKQGLAAGARAYLAKPFQPTDLHELIEGIVGGARK